MPKQWLLIVFMLLGLGWSTTIPARAALPVGVQGQPLPSLADMVERVVPAVVNITTATRIRMVENPLLSDPFFSRFFNLPQMEREKMQQSLGSGVIVDAAKGLVITNYHVINKADSISVTLGDGRTVQGKRVGMDQETDVGLIQIPSQGLKAVPLGNSDTLRVGDFVVAIGNPFGLGQTVTSGIISALGRKGLGIEGYEDFIQTDASINPGNSGGALVNLAGELIGINTAILAQGGGNVGIGFAIPVNMAQRIIVQLVQYGEVRRGLLGIKTQDLTKELASAFDITQRQGAVVTQIIPGSAADKAGLHSGDVVLSANGRPIQNSASLRNLIGLSMVGERIPVEFLRDGKHRKVTIEVTEPRTKRIDGEHLDSRFQGSVLEKLEEGEPNQPIMVISVQPNSTAWQAGLREGDLILSVNRQLVRSFEELAAVVKKNRREMLLNIQRGQEGFFILVR
ncbi:MAG: DegQ family serine endoprotease [Nitrospirae bacterium]|nr:DegQ family serine endoprotease [Magnetococcales bacterium]HAT48981.1 serine endoprotease DegQ [Alphaproteobacteria bacterium]